MIAIVLEPPAFLPSKPRIFRSSWTGTVREATDCLKRLPSWFRAASDRFARRLKCRRSDPIAVDVAKFRSAYLTRVAEASIEFAKILASSNCDRLSF